VWLEERRVADIKASRLEAVAIGTRGQVTFRAEVVPYDGKSLEHAELTVADRTVDLHCERRERGLFVVDGRLELDQVKLWWPHTHGEQPLYAARLNLRVGAEQIAIDLGRLGFRHLEVDTTDGGFGLCINDVPVFARGACWTTIDVVTLGGDSSAYRSALVDVQAAGMNLLRLSGTHLYEADWFYDLCDELGILVWQDFMFANMDYPIADSQFAIDVQIEAAEILQRLSHRPSLAVLCGGSEVEQQAAMLGLPRASWCSSLFSDVLPSACAEFAPHVPYVPSSPHGGTLPFQVDEGVSHYYGVGAYLRPLEDARRAGVRFASECLAFANIPEDATIDQIVPGDPALFQYPLWKERVPRDAGSSWDFEDVRDHYLQLMFKTDAQQLRLHDASRYLALSRIVPGELMASTFAEWRRVGSSCRGGVVWFLRDHWPGAGWGVIDAQGLPKAAYYYLKRALAPVTVFFTDEGLNGLRIHVINERDCPLRATLKFSGWHDGDVRVLDATKAISLSARCQLSVPVEEILERFADTTYAYRFGPPGHDVAAVDLVATDTSIRLATAFHFPLGMAFAVEHDLGLEGAFHENGRGGIEVRVRSRRFAQSVHLDIPGYACADNYFHLSPGTETRVNLQAREPDRPLVGTVQALNGSVPIRLMGHRRRVSDA
jgi:beta-mannosidase